MPFIPHTAQDVAEMLTAIGANSITELFDEIPAQLRCAELPPMPPALNEQALMRLARDRARQTRPVSSFLGAGAYEHHIPAAVWQLVTRGEFYTAYTPYQAEASQGTLQVLYEWQSMIASLTGMDVSNASLYDGATATAEAVLMAVRAARKPARRALVPESLHPHYRSTLETALAPQGIVLQTVPFDARSGCLDAAVLEQALQSPCDALLIAQPNFFGVIEDADALCDLAHAMQSRVIAVANPLALGILKPPGEWGSRGADIVCGEAQPLGIPLSGGGPFLGYMACKADLLRQLPGRIAGRTLDADGRTGYTLTLQAREQHIRRSKATSNICTNQGLMVTAASIHMALLGPDGLAATAAACHANASRLRTLLLSVPGVEAVFDGPMFHEFVVRLKMPLEGVLARLETQGIAAGYRLGHAYRGLENALLVCATETKTHVDLERYAESLNEALNA